MYVWSGLYDRVKSDLKSECVMAWEDSFSRILVTDRCNGWFGFRSMC